MSRFNVNCALAEYVKKCRMELYKLMSRPGFGDSLETIAAYYLRKLELELINAEQAFQNLEARKKEDQP